MNETTVMGPRVLPTIYEAEVSSIKCLCGAQMNRNYRAFKCTVCGASAYVESAIAHRRGSIIRIERTGPITRTAV